ncbi:MULTISPECIES: hypothetical protein, partial [unclassified Bradyrhizobium]|uniref:hypothetical protein n=1 Tax=unclassified Bradyrhizobium TaxID=2631580 RepID=UPI001FF7A85D
RPKPSKDGQADPDAQAEARIEAVEQFGQVATELLQLNTAGLFQQHRPNGVFCAILVGRTAAVRIADLCSGRKWRR